MNFTAADRRNHSSVRRKMGIDPTASGKFRDLGVGAAYNVKFARKGDEQFTAVLRHLEIGKAPQTLAFPFAAASFFRRQFFFRTLQQLFRREDLAERSLRDGELIKAKNRVARAAAQENHTLSIGRDLR